VADIADHEALLSASASSAHGTSADVRTEIAVDISRLESLYAELSESLRAAVVAIFGESGDGQCSLDISTARAQIEVNNFALISRMNRCNGHDHNLVACSEPN
jgi:hypothetical protein